MIKDEFSKIDDLPKYLLGKYHIPGTNEYDDDDWYNDDNDEFEEVDDYEDFE